MPYDVRIIANHVLNEAEARGLKVTNLSLNKILFFINGIYSAKIKMPLINEDAEAWEYGPVYREIYNQFKELGSGEIKRRARKLDFHTGRLIDIKEDLPDADAGVINSWISTLLNIPTWQLVEISHSPEGPWFQVWNYKSKSNPGMVIPYNLIENCFSTGYWLKERGLA